MIGSNSILNTIAMDNRRKVKKGFTDVYNIVYDPLAEKITHVDALDIYHFCTNKLKPKADRNVFCLEGCYEGHLTYKYYVIFRTIKKNNVAYLDGINAYNVIDMNIEKDKQGYVLKAKYNTTDELIVKLSKKIIKNNVEMYEPEDEYFILNGAKVKFDTIIDICKAISIIGEHNIKPGRYKLDEFLKDFFGKILEDNSILHSFKDKCEYELYVDDIICKGLINLVVKYKFDGSYHTKYYYPIYIINKNNSIYALIRNYSWENIFIIYDMVNGVLDIHKLGEKYNVIIDHSLYNGEPYLILEVHPGESYYILEEDLTLKKVKEDDLFYFVNIGCEDNWKYIIFQYKLLNDAAVEYSEIIIPTHFKKCTRWMAGVRDYILILTNSYKIDKLNDKGEYFATVYKYILSHRTT